MITKHPKVFFDELVSLLRPTEGLNEAKSIVYLVFEKKLDWLRHHVLVNDPKQLTDKAAEEVERIITEVAKGKPVQQLLGTAEFYGMELLVNEHVLIPRPETEELVDLVIKENERSELSILDIGTGSGCISIALKRHIPGAKVYAMDLSQKAIDTAKKNTDQLGLEVQYILQDFLTESSMPQTLDCVVSNPPYIGHDELSTMSLNTKHEPQMALFPIGTDPLIFYRKIAQSGRIHLNSGGKVYVEINENYPTETMEIFNHLGYQQVRLFHDLNDRPRIVRAINP